MHGDILEVDIVTAYNADKFIDDLKEQLEGEIDALRMQPEIDELTGAIIKVDPELTAKRVAVIKEIIKRLNLA